MSLSWTTDPQPENDTAELITGSDPRVSQRIPMEFWARLFCEAGAGKTRATLGHVLNVSGSGMLVEVLRPLAVGSLVRIQASDCLAGRAYVRHSTRQSWRFRVGLEFAAAVRSR
jgi:hypothetical protein